MDTVPWLVMFNNEIYFLSAELLINIEDNFGKNNLLENYERIHHHSLQLNMTYNARLADSEQWQANQRVLIWTITVDTSYYLSHKRAHTHSHTQKQRNDWISMECRKMISQLLFGCTFYYVSSFELLIPQRSLTA